MTLKAEIQAALNDTRLWSVVDLSQGKNWIYQSFHRSGRSPLKVILKNVRCDVAEHCDIVGFASRINTLDVTLDESTLKILCRLVSNTSWKSENLLLEYSHSFPCQAVSLPFSFVRNLTLDNVSLPWGASFPILRELNLISIPLEQSPSLHTLQAWLQASQQELRVLTLTHVDIPPASTPLSEPIDMPHLHTITLSGDPRVIKDVLALIRTIPRHAQVTIKAYGTSRTFQSLAQLLPPGHSSPLSTYPARTLHLYPGELIADKGRLTLKMHPVADRVFASRQGLNKFIPLAEIVEVTMGKNFLRKISREDLTAFLEDLKAVQMLTVEDGNDIESLFSVISLVPEACPMLRVIRLDGIKTEPMSYSSETYGGKVYGARKGIRMDLRKCEGMGEAAPFREVAVVTSEEAL